MQKEFWRNHDLLLNYSIDKDYMDVVIPGGVPAIVPQELFDRVQERVNMNRHAPARAKAHEEYLLSGKLICGDCGRLMVGESGVSQAGRVHTYYKCLGRKRRLGCHRRALRKYEIEDAVIYYTVRDVLNGERIRAIAHTMAELQRQKGTTLPALRRQLADTEKGIENMVDAIQQGIFTKSTKQRLDELEARREALQSSILQAEITHPLYSEEDIVRWLTEFKGGDTSDFNYRRRLVDTFIQSVYSYEGYIVIFYNFHDGSRMVSNEDIQQAIRSDFKTGTP